MRVLHPLAHSVLLGLIWTVALGSAWAAAVPVELAVDLAVPTTSKGPQSILIVAEPEGGGDALTWPLEAETLTISLDDRRVWFVWAEAEGFWGEELRLESPSANPTVRLRLYPTGLLEAELEAESALPASFDAFFDSARSRQGALIVEGGYAACPVEDGRLRCELPPGVFDVELRSGFYVRQLLRGVEIETGAATDVGVVELELGGAVTGWVEVDDGGAPAVDCVVSITGPNRAARGEDEVGIEQASCAGGWFELIGVPAGSWRVAAEQAEYALDESPPFVVEPGLTLELQQPLRLTRPTTLDLVFDPQLDPEQQPWRFTLAHLEVGQPGRAVEEVANADGTWTGEGMVAGNYRLELADIDPSWFVRDLVLEPAGSLVVVRPTIVSLEGWLTLGRDPLVAEVAFGPGQKEPIEFESDETGYFSGLLPRPGVWKVGIEAPGEGVAIELDRVEVVDVGGGQASVQLELPGTELEGWVKNPQGDPVRGATVRVRSRSSRAIRKVKTDEEGHFLVRGLPAELVSVRAEMQGARPTSWFEVSLEDGSSSAPLQLVLVRRRQ